MNRNELKIGVLISGGGSNLQALMDACKDGRINGKITFVGSDTSKATGLKRAEKKGIPFFTVEYSDIIRNMKQGMISTPEDFNLEEMISKQTLFKKDSDHSKVKSFLESRAACEAKLIESMKSFDFDILALAGFMRTLSPYFIDRINRDPFLPKIMNIHPALLPSFPGIDGYGDTFRYGCKVGGCTVHFVDYGEDSGPIIGQKSFPILPEDDLESVKKKGLEYEWELYPECVSLYGQGRLKVVSERHELKGGQFIERKVVKILPKP